MSHLFIIILTIFVSCQGNLMYENITGISLQSGMHIWIILYTCLCAVFYAYKVNWIYKQLSQQRQWINIAIIATAFVMSIGSFFPYTINSHDLFSQLHVYCSMLSCLSFLFLLFLYNRFLSYENAMIYNQIHWFYDLGVQFLGVFFIVFTRVNGYLEILFAILVSGYLYLLEKQLKRKKDF